MADGFVALFEYREHGGGASSHKLVLIDLPSGRAQLVDGYALTATFHGGAGGPPRPGPAVVLGNGLIAWVRLAEGAGGTITGELRVGLPHRSAEAPLVVRSDALLRPVAIVDGTTLVYVISADRGVELRAREIASGAERVLATGQMGTGGIAPFAESARSGTSVAWIEESPQGTSTLRVVDVRSGATRDMPLGQSYCVGLTGNVRYFALNCTSNTAPPRVVLLDTASWTEVPVAPVTANGPFLLAAGGITELLWQDRIQGRQRVLLFTPTISIASPGDGPFRDLVSRENAPLGYRISLPSRYRLALSSAEPDNVGRDFYTTRTEEEIREICRRGGGIGLQSTTDIQIVVHGNATGVSPTDFVSGSRRAIFTAIERVTIGGYDAARVVHLPSGETAYYVISANERLYEIAPSVPSQPSPPELTAAGFDQIVATFSAIPPKPVASPTPPQTLCGR